MSSISTKYKLNPFTSSKRRKRKTSIAEIGSKRLQHLTDINTGCWRNQNFDPSGTNEKKRDFFHSDESGVDTDDNDDYDISSQPNWIISPYDMEEHLEQTSVCRFCYSALSVAEILEGRAGLATKVKFKCKNDCNFSQTISGFNTTPKQGHFYEINRQSVLAARLIGKGRQGLEKLCSVLGLSSPVSSSCFVEHTKALESVASELLQENLKAAGERARKVETEKEYLENDFNDPVDIATCFDGSWSSRGWTARDGIVAAVAEGTSQVVDVVYKTTSCRQCSSKEEKKKCGEITFLEHLSWYVDHEPSCFLNHNGSSQVS